MKNVLIAGATGMIGGIVLQHCLASDAIGRVYSLSRRASGLTHPKLEEIIHKDFSDFSGLESVFQNIDIAQFCIGVYTGAVSDEVFKTITVDYTMSFADALKAHSPQATFCFLSGNGADPTEKSRVSFARYKGMAENHLSALDFDSLYIFRPAYIYPVEKRQEPNLMYRISRGLYPLIKLFGKNASIKSTELGEAMFKAGMEGASKQVLENRDILEVL